MVATFMVAGNQKRKRETQRLPLLLVVGKILGAEHTEKEELRPHILAGMTMK
jgi:hypothetical protein